MKRTASSTALAFICNMHGFAIAENFQELTHDQLMRATRLFKLRVSLSNVYLNVGAENVVYGYSFEKIDTDVPMLHTSSIGYKKLKDAPDIKWTHKWPHVNYINDFLANSVDVYDCKLIEITYEGKEYVAFSVDNAIRGVTHKGMFDRLFKDGPVASRAIDERINLDTPCVTPWDSQLTERRNTLDKLEDAICRLKTFSSAAVINPIPGISISDEAREKVRDVLISEAAQSFVDLASQSCKLGMRIGDGTVIYVIKRTDVDDQPITLADIKNLILEK